MQAFFFYLTYPFIYLIASLPFGALYKVSDFLYYALRISGYRRKVVIKNLRNSFPEKSDQEINAICSSFYRYLCDLIVETLKTLTMTEQDSRERCHFHGGEWLDELYLGKKSFIIVMGHYGNWEWAGPSFTLGTKFQLVVIYRPLTNRYFEKMTSGMRTKFGTRITPVNQTLRDMVANRGQLTATAFIADQTPSHENVYWTNFLNQDTAVFMGPEKLAIRFNYPVVYMNIQRPKRGYYDVFPELLFTEPKETKPGEISEAFTRRLEKEILRDPTFWLWSHRRWKNPRPK
jgi:Kdo2-lipid IVA lauroyltransferase/acyltransferase